MRRSPTAPRSAQILTDAFDRQARRLPHAKPGRVEGRDTDGSTRITHLDGSCSVRLGITGARTGEVVVASPVSVVTSRGAAGLPLTARGTASTVWVERLDPDCYMPGESLTVTVIGRGFIDGMLFEFLLADFEPNLFITINGSTFIDAESYLLDIFVDQEAPEIADAPLSFERRTTMSVKTSAYSIKVPPPEPEPELPTPPGTDADGPPVLSLIQSDRFGPRDQLILSRLNLTRFEFVELGRAAWKLRTEGVLEVSIVHIWSPDPNERVGLDAIVKVQMDPQPVDPLTEGNIEVWDWVNDTYYGYQAPDNLAITQVAAWEGQLYWMEFPRRGGGTVRCMRSNYDLTDVTEIGTVSSSFALFDLWLVGGANGKLVANLTAEFNRYRSFEPPEQCIEFDLVSGAGQILPYSGLPHRPDNAHYAGLPMTAAGSFRHSPAGVADATGEFAARGVPATLAFTGAGYTEVAAWPVDVHVTDAFGTANRTFRRANISQVGFDMTVDGTLFVGPAGGDDFGQSSRNEGPVVEAPILHSDTVLQGFGHRWQEPLWSFRNGT